MDRILRTCAAASLSVLAAGLARAGNPAHGKELFAEKCTTCHNADKGGGNRIGPNLFGVVGRPAGSLTSFNYSSAMKNAGIVWTPDKLAGYLAGPQKMIPGIRMTFPGFANPSDARDVIGYLSTLKSGDAPSRRAAE